MNWSPIGDATGTGAYNMSGGTLTSAGNFQVGAGSAGCGLGACPSCKMPIRCITRKTDGGGMLSRRRATSSSITSPVSSPRRSASTMRVVVAKRLSGSFASIFATAASIHSGTPGRRVGTGFRDALWPDSPTLDVLDAATGDIPTYLINADVHSVWLNTAALRREGHEPDGTGILREGPAFEISRRHRFARELASLPDDVRVHVLPTGGVASRDDTPWAYRDMAAVGRRISRAYTASRRYLAANVHPTPPGGR